MKAQEIFEQSVRAMKTLLAKDGMMESIRRAKERGEEGNVKLLHEERNNVNELVRRIALENAPEKALRSVRQELRDAVVVRYLRNREIFMKTFPDGIEGVDPDPVAIWATIMISPADEGPAA